MTTAESPQMARYFESINQEVKKAYRIAGDSKKKGFDPDDAVTIPLAKNMAERVEGLISTAAPEILGSGIVERITELEIQYGSQDWRVALKIAEEVALEKFCKFENKKRAIEIGIRIGFAYVTVGVVSSPLEGFSELKFKRRKDNGQEYFCLMYSGPIRSAGGTGASVSVLIADYVRKKLGYAQYDATENEINRMNTELADYHDRVTNLQYYPSIEEVSFMMKNLPVQIDGDPSEKFDVSNYKDLDRIETNKIRNGPCLVIAECLCAKAPKVLKKLNLWGKEFDLEQWTFMGEFVDLQKKIKASLGGAKKETSNEKVSPDFTFIKDLIGGRPVISHPLRNGGFRLRYGRSRTSGFSSDAISPATMAVLENYIAIGTQLKMERPGKATTLTTCDSIDGPIVRLTDGSVKKLRTFEEAKKYSRLVDEIVYLGDVLINYGDFRNRNHKLLPAGFVEEWWVKYLSGKPDSLSEERFNEILKNPFEVSLEEAKIISRELKVPLHPKYIFYWNTISNDQFLTFYSKLKNCSLSENRILVPNLSSDEKRIFELIGVEHKNVKGEYIIIEDEEAAALMDNLGNLEKSVPEQFANPLEAVNSVSEFKIKDKCGYFIGARMGRPEKAKLRKLKGSPNVLFPIGEQGGKFREFSTAIKSGMVKSNFPLYFCEKCLCKTIQKVCENCGSRCRQQYYCRQCSADLDTNVCPQHGKCLSYKDQSIDVEHYLKKAQEILKVNELPDSLKGVRGTSNAEHIPENIAKGILRSQHRLSVNKDGTIRYDMTEMACTHFKPKEVGASIKRLIEMGYDKDIYGDELVNDDQILELFAQDIILPACPESPDEGADKSLFRVAKFIDDLLVKLYGLEPYYNLNIKEELIGHLVVAMSPHTSAGIVSRIVGFSKVQGLMAHPLLHSIMRRDCVHPHTKFICYDSKKKSIFSYKIGNFVDRLIDFGAKTTKIDSTGTISIQPDSEYYVYGINPITNKIQRKKVKFFIKGPVPKKWIRITTATGRKFSVTPTHKLMYLDNKLDFKLKNAEEVMIGDKIPLLTNFPEELEDSNKLNLINLLILNTPKEIKHRIRIRNADKFFKSIVKKNGRARIISLLSDLLSSNQKHNLYDWYKSIPLDHIEAMENASIFSVSDIPSNSKITTLFTNYSLPVYLNIDNELLSIIGYYLAEGYCRQNKSVSQVAFRIDNKQLQNRIVYLIKKTFNLSPNLGENNTKITICNQLLYYLFRFGFGLDHNAYSKRVPSFAYGLPKHKIKSLISSYFDGDGSVLDTPPRIAFYSVSRDLLDDVSLLLLKFGIVGRYQTTKERLPGKKVLEIYKKLNKTPKKHILHHLTFNSEDITKIIHLLESSVEKKSQRLLNLNNYILNGRQVQINHKRYPLIERGDYSFDYVKNIELIKEDLNSYCVEIDWKTQADKNILWGEQILNTRCDGDEAAVLLLMDHLLNFSSKFLPKSRGSTQDAPLVLTSKLIPSEVDDMVFDMDIVSEYPLELYEAAEQYKSVNDVKITVLNNVLNTEKQYEGMFFTHHTSDFNKGVLCSAYKTLPTMQEKVDGQMEIARKIRAVDTDDVARLVIEKHLMRDIKGCLRKFSMQSFRCVNCNEIYRRIPMAGKCLRCEGKIAFTIAEGSVKKYLDLALNLSNDYNIPPFLKQTLDLTKNRIESVFGKDAEQQVNLAKWAAK